jgi:hypothetical protein
MKRILSTSKIEHFKKILKKIIIKNQSDKHIIKL